jgi:hypothetical protein
MWESVSKVSIVPEDVAVEQWRDGGAQSSCIEDQDQNTHVSWITHIRFLAHEEGVRVQQFRHETGDKVAVVST